MEQNLPNPREQENDPSDWAERKSKDMFIDPSEQGPHLPFDWPFTGGGKIFFDEYELEVIAQTLKEIRNEKSGKTK